jgi:hypothetical protein
MTDREKELVKNYPEAAAFAGAATSVWNGSISPAKIEMVVKGKLYAALKNLLHKDIQTVFLTGTTQRHSTRLCTMTLVTLFRFFLLPAL